MCHECYFMHRPEMRPNFVRAVYFDDKWVHVWNSDKNREKTEYEILQGLEALCTPEQWNIELDEVRAPVGVDLSYYGFFVMKK